MDSDELDARIWNRWGRKRRADQQERSETRGGTDLAHRTTPTPHARKALHHEAGTNALAACQPTTLTPS